MNEQEYFWKKCVVEGFFLPKKGVVTALSFYFDDGRVLIYKIDDKQWAFAIEKMKAIEKDDGEVMTAYIPVSTKKFPYLLSDITARKETEFKSMLNTAGFSNRNAGQIIGDMAGKMVEHLEEINVDVIGENDDVDFFQTVENPSWHNIMENLKKIQYIEDDAAYVIDAATFLGSKIIDENPIHTLDIGPPGSGKSQFIKMLTPGMRPNKYVHPISDLTSKSMVSGLEGNEDLYPKLDKKLVTMEEYTIMISKDPTERGAILGQWRAMYGGHYSKTFGSGVGTKAYDSTFGFLAGCTALIDTIAYEMAVAGHRDIIIRRPSDINMRIHEKAVDAAYDDVISDPKLTEAIQDELFSLYEKFDPTSMPDIPDHMAPYIKNCAHITAFLRVAVVRDKFSKGKDVEGEPAIEYGTRLVKVYKKLAKIIAWMLEKPEVDQEVISYIYRVALDTPTANRVSLLRLLKSIEATMTLAELCEELRLPKNTVKIVLEDLKVSDIIDKKVTTIASGNESEPRTETSYYLDKESILYEYISHIELLMESLSPEETHHQGMAVSGLDMYKDKTWTPPGANRHNPDAHGEHGEDTEPKEHVYEPDTGHLTVDDDDPDWNPEPELEPMEERKEEVDKEAIEKHLEDKDKEHEEATNEKLVDPNGGK